MGGAKSQHTIGRVILGIILLIVGESIGGWGLWLSVVWVMLSWEYIYWYGVGLGLLLSGLWGISVGGVSVAIWVMIFIWSRIKGVLVGSRVMEILTVVFSGFLLDRMFGNGFSVMEVVGIILVLELLEGRKRRSGELKVGL